MRGVDKYKSKRFMAVGLLPVSRFRALRKSGELERNEVGLNRFWIPLRAGM
jgi:hypothetical protein